MMQREEDEEDEDVEGITHRSVWCWCRIAMSVSLQKHKREDCSDVNLSAVLLWKKSKLLPSNLAYVQITPKTYIWFNLLPPTISVGLVYPVT
jgi:hypothetical protein